ncbi:ABC transporter substrate-binding protein [Natronogracilivirga saccharolytica]|uniref:ABC transporter substrate-binding protein n=1 Tax=Natronogracilivirga saccharolytica TaxID=2812953 RepID=A0A8J7UVB4_9BACT|nr:ABC transporter substrate-binding protein [Natronogracilivirga saccharolytica]MBP3192376.1 ABC transporter substrate-binding protein [Natronogracilivirga saccharolytica]
MANTLSSDDRKMEIRNILEERDDQIKDLLGPEGTDYTDEQREKLRSIVNDMMDYREMARFALADKFDELESEEQEEFTELFSKIIRDQSLRQLDIYRAEVVYDDIEVDNSSAKVTTTAILDDSRIPVLYRMKMKEGEWVITDMSVDNAWTAESYRRSFQNILRRRGYDALIENLRRRAEQAT